VVEVVEEVEEVSAAVAVALKTRPRLKVH